MRMTLSSGIRQLLFAPPCFQFWTIAIDLLSNHARALRTKVFMSDTSWYGKPLLYLPERVVFNLACSGVIPEGSLMCFPFVTYHKLVATVLDE